VLKPLGTNIGRGLNDAKGEGASMPDGCVLEGRVGGEGSRDRERVDWDIEG